MFLLSDITGPYGNAEMVQYIETDCNSLTLKINNNVDKANRLMQNSGIKHLRVIKTIYGRLLEYLNDIKRLETTLELLFYDTVVYVKFTLLIFTAKQSIITTCQQMTNLYSESDSNFSEVTSDSSTERCMTTSTNATITDGSNENPVSADTTSTDTVTMVDGIQRQNDVLDLDTDQDCTTSGHVEPTVHYTECVVDFTECRKSADSTEHYTECFVDTSSTITEGDDVTQSVHFTDTEQMNCDFEFVDSYNSEISTAELCENSLHSTTDTSSFVIEVSHGDTIDDLSSVDNEITDNYGINDDSTSNFRDQCTVNFDQIRVSATDTYMDYNFDGDQSTDNKDGQIIDDTELTPDSKTNKTYGNEHGQNYGSTTATPENHSDVSEEILRIEVRTYTDTDNDGLSSYTVVPHFSDRPHSASIYTEYRIFKNSERTYFLIRKITPHYSDEPDENLRGYMLPQVQDQSLVWPHLNDPPSIGRIRLIKVWLNSVFPKDYERPDGRERTVILICEHCIVQYTEIVCALKTETSRCINDATFTDHRNFNLPSHGLIHLRNFMEIYTEFGTYRFTEFNPKHYTVDNSVHSGLCSDAPLPVSVRRGSVNAVIHISRHFMHWPRNDRIDLVSNLTSRRLTRVMQCARALAMNRTDYAALYGVV